MLKDRLKNWCLVIIAERKSSGASCIGGRMLEVFRLGRSVGDLGI